jgi:hypothetical protein
MCPIQVFSKFLCSIVVLNLAPYLILPSLAANGIKKPLQGHVEQKGKVKLKKSVKIEAKSGNPYSISKPYNPDDPPPIDNKIHPVSSNDR